MNGKFKTMDGNSAATYSSYAFTEVAAIYPITPSSTMAEQTDEWSATGVKNIFGQEVRVIEMQSEAGAAGAVHGSLAAGALTTTYTASQGLLLMIPNMYKIAGELLPCVFHVSARTLATHALSIFGDHSDVMACRQTGFVMIASSNPQEVLDLAAVSHLASIKSSLPFLHFFDGFRTSSEIQKVEATDYKIYEELLDKDALNKFRKRSLNPERPVLRGTAQNPDIFFQAREAVNPYYDKVPGIVQDYMDALGAKTGRNYKLFDYYGAPDAEYVIVAMGSACDIAEETIDYLNKNGKKTGIVKVRLYRPFSSKHFVDAIPQSAKFISVLDRTKEPGAIGEPLYQDVVAALEEQGKKIAVVGGRYGLASKDTTPAHIAAVYNNLFSGQPKNHFTVGIKDDVTHLSLPVDENLNVRTEGTISCKFWGFGSDGTVGANKNSIKIIGDHTDMYVQAYFAYDSKKSGGVTISHLRFGKNPIKSSYLVSNADFVACHNASYIGKYDMAEDLVPGGTFLLNCSWDFNEIEEKFPAGLKRFLAANNISLYTVDAVAIAKELGLGARINTIMQAAFFKLANIIPVEDARKYMKDAIVKSYGKKGEAVINMNFDAVDRGIDALNKIDIPASWADITDEDKPLQLEIDDPEMAEFVNKIMIPMNRQKGDTLPVSAFIGREDGTFPQGTAKFEKRGIAIDIPEWQPESCIQCNQCAYVCPHAAIRPFLPDNEELKNAPSEFATIPAKGRGFDTLSFRIQVSALDCTGCGNCANICPAKPKALIMKPLVTQMEQAKNWEFAMTLKQRENPMNKNTVKGSQFEVPLFEFSGACAGCGETPYARLITQLFGDRMVIANATGCSSIWGGSAPSAPYTVNAKGHGPAWANSLFEDNAEFGYGMRVATTQIRNRLKQTCSELADMTADTNVKECLAAYLENAENGEASKKASYALISALESYNPANDEEKALISEILNNKENLVKKSQWILGGDGWAYDIGFGGLDHVLAAGDDVNILVFDTEVYSNTGGQSSKATSIGAVAQFAYSGKATKKKDLGMIAMSYGYVYVAQVAMGANQAQLLRALNEAESYPGPSLIIAYAPCIHHGISTGMGTTQFEQKRAVECGYWHLYRYNPLLKEEGKNPFILDSKVPTASLKDFVMGEVRYSALKRAFPERAEKLYTELEKSVKEKYEIYERLAMTN